MSKSNFSIRLVAASLVATGLMVSSGTQAESVYSNGGGHAFQFAYVTRGETDRFNGDGTEEVISGKAESLQSPKPGRIVGSFEERILLTDPETDFAPVGYPAGSFIGKVVESVSTHSGDIYFEALILAVPGANGDFLTSALSGEITGGTRAFRKAEGNVTMAGKISICDLGELGCAASDLVPAPLGLNYECHFILRGKR